VLRQTIRQRLQAKLGEVKTELKRHLHDPIPELGKWLGTVVRAHLQYFGVLMNMPALFLLSVAGRVALAPCAIATQSERPRGPEPNAAPD